MGKQKSPGYKKLEGSSSLRSSQHGVTNHATMSVKDKLHELRQAEPAEAVERKRALAETLNRPSQPPNVQQILGHAAMEQIPERPRRMRDRIRTPGPAPPSSWLHGDVSGGDLMGRTRRPQTAIGSERHGRSSIPLNRFKRLYSDQSDRQTLTSIALHKLAPLWHIFDQEEKAMFSTIPHCLRSELISFLNHHQAVITIDDLRTLVVFDLDIKTLDLAGLIGRGSLTLPALTSLLKSLAPQAISLELEQMSLNNDGEDWDSMPISEPLRDTSFLTLTHLCLSHPPQSVRWQDLLALSAQTPFLTHLSLAYWPRPSLTPNLYASTVTNSVGHTVNAGGSHHYSEFDGDYTEPIAVLNRLSSKLLSLKFLDIEGNHNWITTLALSRVTMTTNWRALARIYCDKIPFRYEGMLQTADSSLRLHQLSVRQKWENGTEVSIRSPGQAHLSHLKDSRAAWSLALEGSCYINALRYEAGASGVEFTWGRS